MANVNVIEKLDVENIEKIQYEDLTSEKIAEFNAKFGAKAYEALKIALGWDENGCMQPDGAVNVDCPCTEYDHPADNGNDDNIISDLEDESAIDNGVYEDEPENDDSIVDYGFYIVEEDESVAQQTTEL